MLDASNLIIVNGVAFPPPAPSMQIIHSQVVDSGRNANGTVVGQKVGRKLWKLNNLEWRGLTPEQWQEMKEALEPFFVKVTFTADDNRRHTVTMYPSDTTGEPYHLTSDNSTEYAFYKSCKFNLIDCGIPGED